MKRPIHFLKNKKLSKKESFSLIQLASAMKKDPGAYCSLMKGKHLSLIFEKPSLRTRLSFEVGFKAMGGEVSYLSQAEVGLGKREAIDDVAKVLSRFSDMVAIRTFKQGDLELFAKASHIPVINALTDRYHPCQALADALTLYEHFGSLEGLRCCFVGDGNNVCQSLVDIASLLGFFVYHTAPKDYALCSKESAYHYVETLKEAAKEADVIYTDVWASMGEEQDAQEKNKAFSSYQVTDEVLGFAKEQAVFMHCLPAHRGEEVAASVMDSKKAIVFDQAENRMHAQKALMAYLMGLV